MGQPITESETLLNAQIGFLDVHLALIHVQLSSLPFIVQPLIQLLIHNSQQDEGDNSLELAPSRAYWHPFVNVSVTTTECSVVCSRYEADRLFVPIRDQLPHHLRKTISISQEDYSAIAISGEGLEAGRRVLDLTSPLALAGISIFFITSYWCDFILVPFKTRAKVIHALEERGFVFEAEDDDGDAGFMTNPASPMFYSHSRPESQLFDFPPITTTPPPTNVSELQTRTFQRLDRAHVKPTLDKTIELVTCAGMKESVVPSSQDRSTMCRVQLGLIKCLTSLQPPKFFSFTLTDSEPASITIEKRLLCNFTNGGEDILLGKDGPIQVPITLDLHELPLESTGIVCGVASRLIDGMRHRIGKEMFNLSYLSTARAGHVIVYEEELTDVMDLLEGARQRSRGSEGHDGIS